MVYEAGGMFGSLLGASFEGFVIDNDILGSVQRVIRGVEVNSDTLDLDAIEQSIRGEGHFLGGDQTLAAMQRDYFYPPLSDRESPAAWQEGGASDMQTRAKLRAHQMLSEHFPTHIDPDTDLFIRSKFNIHLPRKLMSSH